MNFGKMLGSASGLMGKMGGGGMGSGGMPGGFNPRGGGASPFGQAQQGMGMLGGGMGKGPGAMAAAGLLSDEHSKTRITELEDELQRTYAALGGKASTGDVSQQVAARQRAESLGMGGPHGYEAEQLDSAYRKPSSNGYEYKDPSAQGAAPGRQAGPMADELKGLPGVVSPGADGMDRVDTGRLTMTNASEIANLRRELDALKGQGALSSGEDAAMQQQLGPSQDPRISDDEKARMMADMGAIR